MTVTPFCHLSLFLSAARSLTQLIDTAEGQAGQLLVQHGRTDVITTVHQAALALHALADGATGVEAGLQSVLTEILMVMHQLGATLDVNEVEETTSEQPGCFNLGAYLVSEKSFSKYSVITSISGEKIGDMPL